MAPPILDRSSKAFTLSSKAVYLVTLFICFIALITPLLSLSHHQNIDSVRAETGLGLLATISPVVTRCLHRMHDNKVLLTEHAHEEMYPSPLGSSPE